MQVLRQGLVIQQSQKLNINMIQLMKLMSMPIYELRDEIQQALDTNPALEVVADHSMVSIDAVDTKREQEADSSASEFESYDEYMPRNRASTDFDSNQAFLEGTISRQTTLQDHLLWQLRLQPISEDGLAIGELLIQNLNPDGFHTEDPYQVCKEYSHSSIKKMITMIQSFDPQGVCTSDYIESLYIQAIHQRKVPEGVISIITEYFLLLEKGNYKELQKVLGLNAEQVNKAVAFIKQLNPFPGRQYSNSETHYIIPDAQVTIKNDELVIIINNDYIPVLGVTPFFDELSTKTNDKSTKKFIKSNITEANRFISSINLRQSTLKKVMHAIVDFQRAFFVKGPKYILPLTLKDIADEVGMHEATISRLAGKKYVQTDWGIFEMRYFFTNSITGMGSSGSRYSKSAVKEIIREIIKKSEAPLSDQKICDILSNKGIKLARRTVTKYRQELGQL